jgi:4-amino-4-deoxy-L-arabinose transferase-like glycosyltransferase
MDKIKKIFSNTRYSIWILFGIILIGIFLRTYNFHNWLYFGGDQARDAALIGDVVNGKAGWPLLGPHMKNMEFKMGPIYYWFEIISAKIFENGPDKIAYPDLFFGILSIPLLYFFLKRYFKVNLSLAIVGLFSVSYFAIKYSRFTWNPNSVPFFVILLLFSFHEFLVKKEKTGWIWIVLVGISMGVGIQLHAILLVLFPIFSLIIFIYSIKNIPKIWKKWTVILTVAMIINAPQIISEFKTGFSNSKLFFSNSNASNAQSIRNLEYLVDCNIQANLNIVSSMGGEDRCDFLYRKLFQNIFSLKKIIKNGYTQIAVMLIGISLLFSGYLLLFLRLKKEKNENKKYFLGLVLVYAILSLLVMLPIGNSLRIRYFMHIVPLPFIFLGLIADFLNKKVKWGTLAVIAIFVLFFSTNAVSIYGSAKSFYAKNKSYQDFAVIGEMNDMIKYMQQQAYPQKEAYFSGNPNYAWVFSDSLEYMGVRQNFPITISELKNIEYGKVIFFLDYFPKKSIPNQFENRKVENYRQFGKFFLYKLQN